MAWTAASGERRCVQHSSRTGAQCRLWGVRGTEPPTCATHGASAPQVKAAAQRRLAEREVRELAEFVEVDVPEFAYAGEAARYLLNRVHKRSVQFGALADQYGPSLTYADSGGTERLRAAVIGEQQWLSSLTKVLSVLVQVEQATAAQAGPAEVIDRVIFALGLAMTNVAGRHPQLGPGFRDEMVEEFRRFAAAWTGDHPEPEHPRVA